METFGDPVAPKKGKAKQLPVQPQLGMAPSGAIREAIGTKIDTTLVPYALIAYAAPALNYGALKYSVRNYEKGFPLSSLLMSIERHMMAMKNGEWFDNGPKGSGLPHIFMLASSIAMLCENHASGALVLDIVQREPDHKNTVEAIAAAVQQIAVNRTVVHHEE